MLTTRDMFTGLPMITAAAFFMQTLEFFGRTVRTYDLSIGKTAAGSQPARYGTSHVAGAYDCYFHSVMLFLCR